MAILAGSALSACMTAHAIEFGPDGMFSLTGFAEFTAGLQNNYCYNCQVAGPTASKQLASSDAVIPGKHYGAVTATNWQVQPYLGAKYDLSGGYQLSGLLSQRWRDGYVDGNESDVRYNGTVDIPNFYYEKNIAVSHEDYGSVRIGSMQTRSWSVTDYPYDSNLGLQDAFASSGAGYGLLSNAVRLASRPFDVLGGDLFVELTYDQGNNNYVRLTPSLYELYLQFHRGDLVIDAIGQDSVNGAAGAWGKAPFSGVTPYSIDGAYVDPNGNRFGGNHQNIALLLARYEVTSQIQVSGAIRRNVWSGASVVYNPVTQSTTGFNVDFTNQLAASPTGYSASSVDAMLGARLKLGRWTYLTGLTYLGAADTRNPSDRGQSNTATFATVGLKYDYAPGLQLEATAGEVRYGHLGLSPMSMPSNSSFFNVDSRITQEGNFLSLGFIYTF